MTRFSGVQVRSIARRARPDLLIPLSVTALAALIRGWGLGHPDGLVWDEVYYGVEATDPFNSGLEMAAVHPPVGTKLIAVGIGILGDDPVGRRIVPFIVGTLVVTMSYYLARRLLGSPRWAGLVALFVALDGLQIVHSRTAVLDIFVSFFVLAAVLSFFRHLEALEADPGRLGRWTIACGALGGLAMSTKWVAAPTLVGMAVLTVLAADPEDRRKALRISAIAFVAVPAAIYLGSYSVSWFSGDVSPFDWIDRQREILKFHRELNEPHEFASQAYGWPLMIRPVPYFYASRPGGEFEVLAVGNPVLWWSFAASLPALLTVWWRRRDWTVEVVLAAWVILFIPWLLVLRPVFFYYLTPLVPFMALGVVWCLRELERRWTHGRWVTVGFTAMVVLAAIVFMPIWLGLWISPDHMDRLLLFDGWRFPGTG